MKPSRSNTLAWPPSARLTAVAAGATRIVKSWGEGPISRVRVKIGLIWVRRVGFEAGQFENLCRPDGIREDHLVAVAIESLVMSPSPRQRTVEAAVSTSFAEVGKAMVFGVRPAGKVAVRELGPCRRCADGPGGGR